MKNILFEQIYQIEVDHHQLIAERLFENSDLEEFVRYGLIDPRIRPAALRILINCFGTNYPELFASELFDLASVAHSDIHMVRIVIKAFPREWLLENSWNYMRKILSKGGGEEYRRFVELASEIDRGLVEKIIKLAKDSHDSDVTEVAKDFAG